MRPPEIDAVLSLTQLVVNETEDSGGDEPYLWVLGFKVDADTIGAPSTNPPLPTLNVATKGGGIPWVVGNNSVDNGQVWPIPSALGTRAFRLKPKLLDFGGWFGGFAGIVCLLWDQDSFSPTTSEAGHKAFEKVFGSSLADQLNVMLAGDPDYDAALNRDVNGNPLPVPVDGFGLQWRIGRLGDSAALKNLTKVLKDRVKDAITGPITDAIKDEMDWDEYFDPDDLLGVDAAVFSNDQLRAGANAISLTYTDDESNYEIRGTAHGARVHRPQLLSSVLSSTGTFAGSAQVVTHVCRFPETIYTATATRLVTTQRFSVVDLSGGSPTQVRWVLDGVLLDGAGTVPVTLAPVSSVSKGPTADLAATFPGGAGVIGFSASGASIDITNLSGDGVLAGTLTAVVAYPGDPTLSPSFPVTPADVIGRGYAIDTDVSIVTLQIAMDQHFIDDLTKCLRSIAQADLEYIPRTFNPRGDPDAPHPNWKELQQIAYEQQVLFSLAQGKTAKTDVGQVALKEAAQRLLAVNAVSPAEFRTISQRIAVH